MEILKDVCAGLQAAHARGWVHRDLKPGNILLDEDGRALLSDFGLARSAQVSSSASSSLGGIGTPFYRAPELWRGKPPATPATDVYALGCILYEMLTGQVLFKGDTPDEVITRHLVNRPQFAPGWPPAGAPASLAKVVAKALARDPAKRYPDASTFWTALQVIDIGQPHQAAGEETVPAARRVPTSVLVLIGFFFLAGILTIAILLGKMVFNFPAAAPAPTSTLAAISTQTAQASETRSISPVPTITMVPSKTPSPTALNYFNHFQVISDTPGELVFSVDYQYSGEFNVITITAGCFHNGEDPGCIETGSADYGPIQGPSSGTLVFHLGIYGTNPSPMITEQIYLGIEPWGTGYRIATQVFDYRKQWTTLLPTPTSVIP
jgi:serine/threonine-protein kinase